MSNIETYRKQIDQINNQILELLSKRLEISKKVGEYKKQNNIPIQDPIREKEILASLSNKGKELGLTKNFINQLFNPIFKNSKDVQK